jgi:hypothetical protein
MPLLLRLLITTVSAISALYFVFWVGGAILLGLHLPIWLSPVFALAAAVAAGRYVWRHTATVQPGLISSVLLGGLATGGIGFAGGFFGPIFLTPEANQGPLLGIFITGPLGFIVGAIGGGVYWVKKGRQ